MICNFCNTSFLKYDYTNIESPNLARMQKKTTVKGNALIIKSDKDEITLPINYCPVCGYNLNKPYSPKQRYSNIIAKNIKEEIKQINITIEQLAEATNIKKRVIMDFMENKRSLNINELERITDYLHISFEDLCKEY